MVIQAKLRRWGNSIGVVIPKDVLRKKNLKEGQEIIIEVMKKETIKELFGSLKFNKSTDEILKHTRKDLEGKWIKSGV